MSKLLTEDQLADELIRITDGMLVVRQYRSLVALIDSQKQALEGHLARKKLYVPHLTEETYAYIKFLFTPIHGDRAYWNYKHLSDGCELSVEKCKELTKVFKILGLVESKKGLLDEEGKTYGSGIGIPYGNQELAVEVAILRYEADKGKQNV